MISYTLSYAVVDPGLIFPSLCWVGSNLGASGVTVSSAWVLFLRINACLYHINLMRESKGERVAGAEIKKHAALYIKGVRGAAAVRDSIMKTDSTFDIEKILKELMEREGETV